MPRFSKHNDAVKYPPKTFDNWFTEEQFKGLCKALQRVSAATAAAWTMPSTLRMITVDTIQNGPAINEVIIPEEWRNKE